MSESSILEFRNVTMEFPAVRALDDVSLQISAGEVHAIVGENGAGKSTLMKILAGVQRPTSGQVFVDGEEVAFHSVRDSMAKGIGMIHQEFNLVDELSVSENIFLGREIHSFGFVNKNQMDQESVALLDAVRAKFSPKVKVSELSVGGKQLVEIARALSTHARILIMDEPTAVLSEADSTALFELIRKLKSEGVTVLYISHRLQEVVDVCDRVTVLRDGKWVATMPTSETSPAQMANLMVGRDLANVFPEKTECVGPVVLEARDFCVPMHVSHASFSVRKGEILGLAGLVGSGRTELAEAMVGARAKTSGNVLLAVDGGELVETRLRSPKDALKAGIAYLSEDRKGLGLHVSLSTRENLMMGKLQLAGSPILQPTSEKQTVQQWIADLGIRVGDPEAPIQTLSGGNQQKVALAKWLECSPSILIFDEPTRGVDIGAKREIYQLIHRLANEGMTCIVISSELMEIIGLCHRAIVMREGKVMGEVGQNELTEENLMRLAAGVEAA